MKQHIFVRKVVSLHSMQFKVDYELEYGGIFSMVVPGFGSILSVLACIPWGHILYWWHIVPTS